MLGTDKEPGIYVRTLNDLFRAIEETSDDMLYSVSMSYLEVRASSNLFTQEHWAIYTYCMKTFYLDNEINDIECRKRRKMQ